LPPPISQNKYRGKTKQGRRNLTMISNGYSGGVTSAFRGGATETFLNINTNQRCVTSVKNNRTGGGTNDTVL
jgi:hypothetical protein